jgi:hypothetical protein
MHHHAAAMQGHLSLSSRLLLLLLLQANCSNSMPYCSFLGCWGSWLGLQLALCQ